MENLFNGMRYIESHEAVMTTSDPVKRHRPAKGSATYHRRIQKKWNKQFGFKVKPCAYKTPFGLVIHPTLVQAMRLATQEAR